MPITITPTGTIALAMTNLAATLAASSTFQTVVGAGNATEALAKILYFWADETKSAHAMPRAIIRNLSEDESMMISTTGWANSGPLKMFLEFPTPDDYLANHQNAGIDFANKIAAIRDEMQTLARGDNADQYLACMTGIIMLQMGEGFIPSAASDDPTDDTDAGDNGTLYWGAEFLITWQGQ